MTINDNALHQVQDDQNSRGYEVTLRNNGHADNILEGLHQPYAPVKYHKFHPRSQMKSYQLIDPEKESHTMKATSYARMHEYPQRSDYPFYPRVFHWDGTVHSNTVSLTTVNQVNAKDRETVEHHPWGNLRFIFGHCMDVCSLEECFPRPGSEIVSSPMVITYVEVRRVDWNLYLAVIDCSSKFILLQMIFFKVLGRSGFTKSSSCASDGVGRRLEELATWKGRQGLARYMSNYMVFNRDTVFNSSAVVV